MVQPRYLGTASGSIRSCLFSVRSKVNSSFHDKLLDTFPSAGFFSSFLHITLYTTILISLSLEVTTLLAILLPYSQWFSPLIPVNSLSIVSSVWGFPSSQTFLSTSHLNKRAHCSPSIMRSSIVLILSVLSVAMMAQNYTFPAGFNIGLVSSTERGTCQ